MPKLVTLPDVLNHAAEQGWTMIAQYDAETVDYKGKDKDQALEALEACDEMHLILKDDTGMFLADLLIVNGLEPDEVIADYTTHVSIGHLFADEF